MWHLLLLCLTQKLFMISNWHKTFFASGEDWFLERTAATGTNGVSFVPHSFSNL